MTMRNGKSVRGYFRGDLGVLAVIFWNPHLRLACKQQKSIRRTLSVMKLKNTLYFLFSLLLTGGIALAQQATPAPPAGAPMMPSAPGEAPEAPRTFSMFIEGGSFLG